jgi:hypothetical protein
VLCTSTKSAYAKYYFRSQNMRKFAHTHTQYKAVNSASTNRCEVQAVAGSDSAVLVAQSSSQINSWVRIMAADAELLKAWQRYASIMIQCA